LTGAAKYIAMAAALAAIVTGCTRGGGAGSSGTPSDTLRIALYAEPHSLNPLLA